MTEKKQPQASEPVFATAQLVWLDQETGEVLEIEVVGTAPWGDQPAEPGFDPSGQADPDARRYRCRIEFNPAGG
jgi:hypothetical protein